MNLPHATAGHLTPIGKAIKAEVLQASELQVDETPIEYLKPGHGSTKQGYLWIYNDPPGGTCYYDWHAGRGHDRLLDFLGYDEQTGTIDYAGTIQCDGFSAYTALAARFKTIRLAGCLAHIRRKFVEAMDQAPEITLPILRLIQRIYVTEQQTRKAGAPPACRELIRRSCSRPIADELLRLIVTARVSELPHRPLGEALTYAINQWDKFIVCLENGRLVVDNNLAENKVRPAKLGARNWMFFGSLEAGGMEVIDVHSAGRARSDFSGPLFCTSSIRPPSVRRSCRTQISTVARDLAVCLWLCFDSGWCR